MMRLAFWEGLVVSRVTALANTVSLCSVWFAAESLKTLAV